jgi:hypothetical protein
VVARPPSIVGWQNAPGLWLRRAAVVAVADLSAVRDFVDAHRHRMSAEALDPGSREAENGGYRRSWGHPDSDGDDR